MIQNLKRGDIIVCVRSYVESEFGYSGINRKYANGNDYLIHIKQGKKYKVENLDEGRLQIEVLNDFGVRFWYDINRFDTVKEMRRRKLVKLKKSQSK